MPANGLRGRWLAFTSLLQASCDAWQRVVYEQNRSWANLPGTVQSRADVVIRDWELCTSFCNSTPSLY